jgi:hypothetical protein
MVIVVERHGWPVPYLPSALPSLWTYLDGMERSAISGSFSALELAKSIPYSSVHKRVRSSFESKVCRIGKPATNYYIPSNVLPLQRILSHQDVRSPQSLVFHQILYSGDLRSLAMTTGCLDRDCSPTEASTAVPSPAPSYTRW